MKYSCRKIGYCVEVFNCCILFYFQVLPPPSPLIDYEKLRVINVNLDNEVYKMIGLPTIAADLRTEMKKGKKKENIQEEGSKYDPGVEEHIEDDGREKLRKVHHHLLFILI